MAQPQMMQIKLSRFDAQPWGFRLQGGTDFAAPLLVQKVNGGSLAEQAGLMPGDAVIKINDIDVFNLRHKDAQDIVVRSGNNFVITVQRGGSTWRPHVTPTGQMPQPNSPYMQTVTKTSLAHKQQDSQHIGCGYNNAAKPFGNGVDGNVKSIVNKQYNSPVGIYSDESIAETLSAQAEVLAGGVLGVNFKKNEKEYQAEKSEVLKFLREEESGPSTPAFNNHPYQEPQQHQHQQQQHHHQQQQYQPPQQQQHQHHHQQQHHQQQQSTTRHVTAPVTQPKPPSTGGLPTGQNICVECERLITGVFVRIKDRNLHVECFKCATCGTSLKNQGYYNFNNKLYCDIHAKLAAMQNPPTGTEGYVPIPIKPNTKLSATTISSALNAHGYNNGVSNGSSTPAPVNQGGYARPYGAAPPAAAPKSPVSYPPQQQQQQWNQPPPTQPKPAGGNAYATLPRSNVGQQEANDEGLQPQYAECYFEEDFEVEEANRPRCSKFSWPPAEDDSSRPPTAAPLYIPPPETQHVVAKPLENPPPPPPGNTTACGQCHCSGQSEQQQQQLQQQQQQQLQQQQQQSQWQSRSAPQLTSGVAQQECESGSDSYTSTSTTTTTTSEEYQRMYAAQVQAYQMQQAYEQSGSEFDYHMDMEVAAMQQQDHLQLSSSQYSESGRRSAQEIIETLVPPLSTYRLVDMVRSVTPSPVPEPTQGSRHVVFLEDPEVKEVDSYSEHHQREEQGNEDEEKLQQKHTTETHESSYEEETEEKGFVKDDRSQILETQRIFQPTPEIKFEIAPVKQIPPTKIPNPCPKEWINPMVRVLTTAPETPFHMVGCLCPKPCECTCQVDPEADVAKEIPEEPPKEPIPEPYERPPSPEPESEPEPVQINYIWDTPTLSKAMTIAPEFELKFAPPASEGIPLPEETEPYMPPPIEVKPYVREDYRPKTPLLRALTTAPEKPFEAHFDRDVPIHILDLPTPKEHLSMKDALRTAPERPYTPLDPENATHMFEEQQKEEEKKKKEFQVLDREEELGLSKEALEQVEYYTTEKRKSSTSAFAAMQAFQPSSQPLSSTTTPRHSISYTKAENDLEYKKYYDAHERYQKRRSYFSQKEQELLQQQQTNTTSQLQEQHQQQQQQTNTREESSLYSSTKASSSSSNSFSAVQQQQQQQTTSATYASNLTQATKSSQSMAYATAGSASTSTKIDVHEIIEEVTDELEHSEVIFPPPSPLSHLKQKSTSSGLHRPESIPKYQRNWTVLPTQSPARTPEPPELRENIPLAFVDTPKTPTAFSGSNGNTVHKPVAQMSARSVSQQQSQSHQQQTSASAYSSSAMSCKTEQRQQQMSSTVTSSSTTASDSAKQQLQLTKPTIPIIVEDRSGPVTMAFQPLDEHMVRDQSQTPSRPYTPSLINKPAPIIPYYQTPEKLCFDEYPAPHAREYDRRSASPFPDRARSPAPGPPPNPLAAIHAPRLKESEVSPLNTRVLQAGSITTGQSYLGAQQAQQQERLLSHTATGTQSAMQSFTQQPERKEKIQVGNMTVERSEKASRLEEQKQSQMQSHTKTQVGNTQIERRRKVTEEFEHTSSAKTIEIRTGSQSSTERRQSYGKTGYVANQARRLSGLEQEITNLTSQSQAISARAATLTNTKFPELHSENGQSKFPTKPVLPSHDESQPPSYVVSGTTANKLDEQASTTYPTAQQTQLSTTYGSSLVSTQQSQSQQQQQQKSLTTLSTTSCSHQQKQQQQQANIVSCSLTKASATTSTNNQAYQSITAGSNLNATSTSATTSSATGITPSGVCPVTGTFCRPGHTCCKQQSLQTSNNNGSRPTASLGSAGCKPPHAPASSNITANVQSQSTAAAAPAPTASKAPSVSAPSNNTNNDSTGGMAPKGGAYGATSAPKRGRGILNKAVSPGVRVPLCNSCSTHIRGPFITALGKIWCPEHFHCVNGNCRRPLQDIGFVEEKGDLYCEYCFEKYLAPTCSKCVGKIKGDCLNAIGKHFHPECFACGHCGKLFGNTPFFLEDGMPYCEADWNELFTTKCFACGFPVEAGDRWVEALNHNYHSQCFNCTYCKQNLEGQSFYNKGGRPFCKNHAR